MPQKLPPLNALKSFEAAARLLSFKEAAVELNITAAAVGYHVRRLEQGLGKKLFHRLNRALLLTDDGKVFATVVQEAFDVLAKGTSLLSSGKAARSIQVRATWSLSSKWLISRLERFHQGNPHFLVRIDSRDDPAEFIHDGIDVALHYRSQLEPRLNSVLLFAERVFPVCTPRLTQGSHPLRQPSDLRYHTLLHDTMTDLSWSDWLRTADVDGVDATAGPVISHSALTIDAALASEGVALGRSPLIADDLAAGRLVRPFKTSLVSSWAYYIECLPERSEEIEIRSFREWVLNEARISETATHG